MIRDDFRRDEKNDSAIGALLLGAIILGAIFIVTLPWYSPTYGLAYLLIRWGWHPVVLIVFIGIGFAANSWALLRIFRWAPDKVIAALGAIEGVIIGFGLIGQDLLWSVTGGLLGGIAGYFLLRRIARAAKTWRGFERVMAAETAILAKLRWLGRSSSEIIAARLDKR